MFSYNNRSFQFRLINLPADVRQEIKKLILDNGGELVNIDDRSVPSFTVPNKYIPGKAIYDIAFIKDCVKFNEIQDLHQYKLGPQKEYDGCIMSIFLYESRSCMHRCVGNPRPQTYICSACGSRNTFIMLDVDNAKEPSQNSCDTLKEIASEQLSERDTSNTLDVSERPGPSHKSSTAHSVIASEKSYNKLDVDNAKGTSQDSCDTLKEIASEQLSERDTSNTLDVSERPGPSHKSSTADSVIASEKSYNKLDVDNAKGTSQDSCDTLKEIASEKLSKRNTSNILDVNQRPGPSQQSSMAQSVIASKKSYNKLNVDNAKGTSQDSCDTLKVIASEKLSERDTSNTLDVSERPGPSQKSSTAQSVIASEKSYKLDVDNAKGPSQNSCDTLKEIASEKLCKRNTFNILDISERPGPSQKSSMAQSVIASKRSYNKDPKSISGDKAHRGPKLREVVPSTSYAVSSDDSDVQEVPTFKSDKLRCKQNDDDNKDSTASTIEIETSSDDSEAKPYITVKDKKKNASHRSMSSKLDITCVENRRPLQRNVDIKDWITRIKNRAKIMERPRTRNFAMWEKWQMLIFLIENDCIERAKGYDVWQQMIRQNNWNRTKMSLNNNFLKSILPCIETFKLPKEYEIRFVNLRNKK